MVPPNAWGWEDDKVMKTCELVPYLDGVCQICCQIFQLFAPLVLTNRYTARLAASAPPQSF